METLLQKIRDNQRGLHGWCSTEKAIKLAELIVNNKSQLCVEIGVFGGSSLIPQGMALQHNGSGIIYGIDPWSTDAALEEMIHDDHKNWWGKTDLDVIHNHCFDSIMRFDLANFCKLIRDKSENVIDQFADNSIDVLHIDGNHSEALSYKDALLYLPKVKVGGFILFDDIYWTEQENYVTTRKAILHLLQVCDKIDLVNDCMIMQKNSNLSV